MHTKEVICWRCEAPNQVEDNTPDLLEALEEIAEGRGRYSMDHMTHAMNTIEDMKQLATEAIRKANQ